MALIVTKTAIAFDEFRVQRILQPDGTTYKYYIAVGYTVLTDEENIGRDRYVELTGARATEAASMFTNLTNRIKQVEGLP